MKPENTTNTTVPEYDLGDTVTSIGDDGLCDEALDRTSEVLAGKMNTMFDLSGVSNDALDKCRRASGSLVLQRESLRRAIERSELNYRRLSEAIESICARLARQRVEMHRLDTKILEGRR
jgi:hypothetical protein